MRCACGVESFCIEDILRNYVAAPDAAGEPMHTRPLNRPDRIKPNMGGSGIADWYVPGRPATTRESCGRSAAGSLPVSGASRSEERRVGKGWRSRWGQG